MVGRYVGWSSKEVAIVCKMMSYAIFVEVSEEGWYRLSFRRLESRVVLSGARRILS